MDQEGSLSSQMFSSIRQLAERTGKAGLISEHHLQGFFLSLDFCYYEQY
jgi:hypothetical protein